MLTVATIFAIAILVLTFFYQIEQEKKRKCTLTSLQIFKMQSFVTILIKMKGFHFN
jgi:hypothetical protein